MTFDLAGRLHFDGRADRVDAFRMIGYGIHFHLMAFEGRAVGSGGARTDPHDAG